MEEYLKTLLEQIRCKKARNVVEEEIRGHLEEQIEEYQMAGMDPKEAEKAAVLDMGDPDWRDQSVEYSYPDSYRDQP